MKGATVTPKERILRGAIIATPVPSVPVIPSELLRIHVAVVVFVALAATCGGFVTLFYGLWLLGVVVEGSNGYRSSELIGDDSLYAPPLYWPWGKYQRHVRRRRNICRLEGLNGVREPWPLDY